jgi:hypothetical protein
MVLNFAPLGWSTPVKDGVLKERDFQGWFAKVCFLAFLLRFYSHGLPTLSVYDL